MVAKAAAPPSPLFHGHRFYLTRTIAANQRQQARNLIEAYDGLITDDPRGAIQLVDAEHLDPRQDWVSVEFVLDSVASGTLQDLSDYMGKEVAPRSPPPPQEPSNRARRIKYTVEDDARMLQFLQSSFPDRFKSMTSVPLSVWTEASRKRVTQHSGQSMHERYRKQLVSKTPQERREILSRGKREARARQGSTPDGRREEEAEEKAEEGANVSLRVPTPPTTKQVRNGKARATRPAASDEDDVSSPDEEEAPVRGKKRQQRSAPERPPARKSTPDRSPQPPAAPARATEPTPTAEPTASRKRRRRNSSPVRLPAEPSEQTEANRRSTLDVVPNKSRRPRPSSSPSSSVSRSVQDTPLQQTSTERGGLSSSGAHGREPRNGRAATPETVEINETDSQDDHGIFFSSMWQDVLSDSTKRRYLQRFFDAPAIPPPSAVTAEAAASDVVTAVPGPANQQTSESDEDKSSPRAHRPRSPEVEHDRSPDVEHDNDADDGFTFDNASDDEVSSTDAPVTTCREKPSDIVETRQVMHSSEEELDASICRIQFQTNEEIQTIVHALYYSSGDYATATAFLLGQSPVGVWTPEDDLLIANLMDAGVTRMDVKTAARDGAFASMRVQRSAEDILTRIRFLL